MHADQPHDALERDLAAIFSANAQAAKPQRRVSGTAIATAAVLVLAAGGGLLLWSPWEGTPPQPVAETKAPPPVPTPPKAKAKARDLFADQDIERPTFAPHEANRHKHKEPAAEPTPPIVVAAIPAPDRPELAPAPVPAGPTDEEVAKLEAEKARAARIDALDAIRTLRLR